MISLNTVCAKLLLNALNIKKKKLIYSSELNNIVEIISNNVFVILMIFENNVVSI